MKSIFLNYVVLSKMRILVMQLVTFALGYLLAFQGESYPVEFIWGLVGTALTAAGAGALNHVIEKEIDKKMERTKNRPLPAKKMGVMHAALYGLVMTLIGFVVLFLTTEK